MRRIVHLSDIHFGAADDTIVESAVRKITDQSPDLIAVSGDLTLRAKSREFIQARAFLDRLPSPQIVVPGNHDVPLYNVYHRFFKRLHKFQKYITEDLRPTFIDAEMAVVGLNTARALTIKNGRINVEQVEFVRAALCDLDHHLLKVVVTHHPFDLPEGSENDIVGRAHKAMPRIAACGGDVFLSGHLHVSNIETTAKRYKLDDGRVALIIQAGTATSIRVRGEVQSFNVLEFDSPTLTVQRYVYEAGTASFVASESKSYKKAPMGWDRI